MKRAVVCVATTPHYQKGMSRLMSRLPSDIDPVTFSSVSASWPRHADVPYAFKACAMNYAAVTRHADLILWADSCILPIRSMEPLWERIERSGYWISHNGFSNYEWTADSAYKDLFPALDLETARNLNRRIPHVVATCFGVNVRHENGQHFLDEYVRQATKTRAFCGPWINTNYPGSNAGRGGRAGPCGPPDVKGHRHDQTAASVLAWRFGFYLTSPPDVIAYPPPRADREGWVADERTILLADGDYQ
jgi:hypothetical protein